MSASSSLGALRTVFKCTAIDEILTCRYSIWGDLGAMIRLKIAEGYDPVRSKVAAMASRISTKAV